MKDTPAKLAAIDTDPSFVTLLGRMMENTVARDSYQLSLWTNFFNNPVFAHVEREFGLLRDEYNILACLVTYGPLTASSVCMVTGRPRNSVGRGVDRLLRRNFIARRPDKNDRRRLILTILPGGRKAHDAIVPLFVEREKMMLKALNQRDRVALARIIAKLMASSADWAEVF